MILNLNEVRTRSGEKVVIISKEGRGLFPIIGYIGNSHNTVCWSESGRFSAESIDHPLDIVNINTVVVYVNMYPDGHKRQTYDSRAQADFYAYPNRDSCIRVEYNKGEFHK